MHRANRRHEAAAEHTQSVLFAMDRWDEGRVRVWCAARGYHADCIYRDTGFIVARQVDAEPERFAYGVCPVAFDAVSGAVSVALLRAAPLAGTPTVRAALESSGKHPFLCAPVVRSVESGVCRIDDGSPVTLFRDVALETRAVKDHRIVGVTFSSDQPVPRWGLDEVLSHFEGDVSMERLLKRGSILKNHNPNVIVGHPENIRIQDGRSGGDIVFGTTPDAAKAELEVAEGNLRGTSAGYRVHQWMNFERDGEYKGRKFGKGTMLAVRWEPIEISLTPIPADPTVGV